MVTKKRALILTSRTGGGHVSLALALRDLLDRDFRVAIEADVLPGSFRAGYSFVGRHATWLWALQFRCTDGPKRSMLLQRLLAPLIARQLTAAIAKHQPDVIVTTHPLLTHDVATVLRQAHTSVPLVLLLSDP